MIVFTESEKSCIRLFDRRAKIHYEFFAAVCWVVGFVSIGYSIMQATSLEEIHLSSHILMMAMFCSIMGMTRRIIIKYQDYIAMLEKTKR
ncbi:MAG: hypothetical protein COV74_10115 [Candidatus Omnitrophica bacterium CG11_big_fil_rev_8_21_14_0_20_45_26]|uniref:Uncharacterized protein n=1 Tax=Candidatus Abzuiibacterium crystallinum TaxID=1974748 RepID=A0A2H0LL87_9BACT|nr:MAG: hypothetical protein COV74_10115 [Candidatus Omnitrophica bacterium CG11_big_fil_rev_8_21_14_0_20_45_26]PIW63793.1 MAG: hypothetical protein COW12_09000 [Candidatus Omnitrophica bacterium CG12_big_fil_rev_8_21_14_0_65_45_16]